MQGNRQEDCKAEPITRADGSFKRAWNDSSHYLGKILLISVSKSRASKSRVSKSRVSKDLTFDKLHIVSRNIQVEGSVEFPDTRRAGDVNFG